MTEVDSAGWLPRQVATGWLSPAHRPNLEFVDRSSRQSVVTASVKYGGNRWVRRRSTQSAAAGFARGTLCIAVDLRSADESHKLRPVDR